jgi:ELWxxDGT repeat protein
MLRRSNRKPPQPRRPPARQRLAVEPLEDRRLLTVTQLVADLTVSSPIVEMGGLAYFAGSTSATGAELWVSDGTVAGTHIVADLVPGTGSSAPVYLSAFGNLLYFGATDASHGRELWVSDGTAAGTQFVADIRPGASSPNLRNFVNAGGTLYFTADDGTHGEELWTTDGTAAGTQMVTDIWLGASGSAPTSLTSVEGTLFFVANDSVSGSELWKTDGTPGGTQLVKDILPGASASIGFLKDVDGVLFFSGNDGINGQELWKSDGTAAGTQMVKDIYPGAGGSAPSSLTLFDGALYFVADDDGISDRELWTSDGTSAGTYLVQAVANGTSPENLASVGDALYFTVYRGSNGYELWKTDGASNGSQLVTTLPQGEAPSQLTNVGGTLFFSAKDSISGTELWISDGTPLGTRMVVDVRVGSASSTPSNLTNVGGTLFFTANDGTSSRLWTIANPLFLLPYGGTAYLVSPGEDLTLAGSVNVVGTAGSLSYSWDLNGEGIYGDATGLNPTVTWAQLVALGYSYSASSFQATLRVDDDLGNFGISPPVTITVTADASDHVELLHDLTGATQSSSPSNLLTIGSTTYFTANDGIHGTELWKTDGTPGGTSLVKDLRSGSSSSAPHNLTNLNGTLLFWANDGSQAQQLWATDGTEAGTVLVTDFGITNLTAPTKITVADNQVYFVINTSAGAVGLWVSNGTASGTLQVLSNSALSVGTLLAVDNRVFFDAYESANGSELWVSDGTLVGTYLVSDINTGTASAAPSSLTWIDNLLWFSAITPSAGRELWVSDGTAAGTRLVKDLYGGTQSATPTNFTAYNGAVYFTAQTGTSQYRLWKSDGTTAGTSIVTSLPARADYLDQVGGKLLIMLAYTNSYHFWSSDGTAAGTVALPGVVVTFGGGVEKLVTVGDRLAFFRSSSYMGISGGVTLAFVDPNSGVSWGPYVSSIASSTVVIDGILYFEDEESIYATDATASGTRLLQKFRKPIGGMQALGDNLIVAGLAESYGMELWSVDQAVGTPSLIADINQQPFIGTPAAIGQYGDLYYFYVSDADNGAQLWTTDGTSVGTRLLGSPTSSASGFVAVAYVNGSLLLRQAYSAPAAQGEPVTRYRLISTDGTRNGTRILATNLYTLNGVALDEQAILSTGNVYDRELWTSDGTDDGTSELADIHFEDSSQSSSNPASLTKVNDWVFFSADDGVHGIELWKTDGTAAGTQLVIDINPGVASSSPTNLVDIDGVLYFSATDGASGVELWKSDGTLGGTLLVADINPGTASSNPGKVTRAGAQYYFSANDGLRGTELWVTDGTALGTSLLRDLRPGSSSSSPAVLLVDGGLFYFQASTPSFRLWRSDGTYDGTFQLSNASPSNLTAFDGLIYFVGGARNLWRTDGTTAGTQLLYTSTSELQVFESFADHLYFVAGDSSFGIELWRTDGTIAGTRRVFDFNPGVVSSRPLHLTSFNDALLFFGTNGTWSGLWKFTPDRAPTANAGGAYSISEGDSLALDASASSDPDADALSYSWDVNGDGIFGDATGVTPTLTWAALQALGIDNGLNSWNVAVRIDDGFGHVVTSTSSLLTVNNAAPTAGISGPASAARDASANYTLTATDAAAADQAAGFTFTIDWNGDGSDVQIVSGLSGLVVAHTFNTVGARTIKVTATDQDGSASSQSSLAVTVSAVQLVDNGGALDLVWGGTAGSDDVAFEELGGGVIQVTTTLENGLATNVVETFTGITGRVIANGGEGNDTLDAANLTTTAATLDGGTGNNTLYGGGASDTLIGGANYGPQVNGPEGQQGSNVIVGGAGDDTIYGNAINGAEGRGGNNILLGGAGDDTIYGNWTNGGEGGGRNILVGGADADTLYDYRAADGAEGRGSILIAGDTSLSGGELNTVMSEWKSTRSYTSRVQNILGIGTGPRNNGSVYLQAGGTVTADAAVDQLWGSTIGTGFNWFWYTLAIDEINRAKAGEIHSTL